MSEAPYDPYVPTMSSQEAGKTKASDIQLVGDNLSPRVFIEY